MSTVPVKIKPSLNPGFPNKGLMEAIGNTPLLRLRHITSHLSDKIEVYGKAEWFNPGGSIKDRPAAAILSHALSEGYLDEGRILLDSTSGNMGIAYATLGASLGIPVHLAIPASAGHQRITILRALGADLTITDPLEGSEGARVVAAELSRRHPDRFYYANQYSHPANWRSHYNSTGPEINSQTAGRVTHFVAGLGTTGTMMGVGQYLKHTFSDVYTVGVQPDGPMHGLEGLKHLPSSDIPEIYDPSVVDETIEVSTEDAYRMARDLAQQEGLLVGISAAAVAVAVVMIANQLESGVIVAIFADSGLKYLDQPFWGVS